ncbi:MAG: HAD family hydrolase [Bacillota bacterium]
MKVAILDFDGTLFDSAPFWENTINTFLLERNITPPQDILGIAKPLGIRGCAELFKERFDIPDDTMEIVTAWRSEVGKNYRYTIPLKEYAREYINYLLDKGIKVCMATAMEREFFTPALIRTGIYDLFELIVTIEDVKADKNSPKIFLHCAEHFGVTPADCTVFEDSYKTAEICQKAGFHVIGVDDGVCKSDFEKMQPFCERYIFSFRELLDGYEPAPNIEMERAKDAIDVL